MKNRYKTAYFHLFSAMCDVMEALEQFADEYSLSDEVRQMLGHQIDRLKQAQQETEECLIQN